MQEKDKIRVPISVVSSIMNNGGYKALLNYLSMQTYKTLIKDEYLDYAKFKDYSFLKENEWIHFMDKLCYLKLAVKNGTYYTTRSKFKEWREFVEINNKQCLKFNGSIEYDMSLLYKHRFTDSLRDIIYIDLRNTVIRNKSISRKWITDLTGLSSKIQKSIENDNEGNFDIELIEHYIPVSSKEIKDGKVGNIPTFNGFLDHTNMSCFKTNSKKIKQSNCRVVQLGNRMIAKSFFSKLHIDKTQYKQKLKSNLSNVNMSSMKNDEVKDWYDYDILIDLSKESITKNGILSCNNKEMKYRKKLKSFDYDKISVINSKGNLMNMRNQLNLK